MNNQTSSLELSHFPVMLNEVIKISSPSNGGNYIDCTFGGGGYSKQLLKFPKTKVKGIDLIYLGMYDISQSVGLPGQLEHPDVMKQLNNCLKIIQGSGKLPGTFARDMDACHTFKDMGFKFVAYLADSYALTSFYKNAVTEFQK